MGWTRGTRHLGRRQVAVMVMVIGVTACSGGGSDGISSPQTTDSAGEVTTPAPTEEPAHDADAAVVDDSEGAGREDDRPPVSTTTVPVPEAYRGPGSVHERPNTVNLMVSQQPVGHLHREFPQSIGSSAIGPDGRLYVADIHAGSVVAIDETGGVEDLGLWQAGWVDGGGVQDLAFDADGILHVQIGDRILRVESAGVGEPVIEPVVDHLPPINDFAFGPDGSLVASDRDSDSLLQWIEGRQWRLVSDQVPHAERISFGLDGSMYVGQEAHQTFMRVDPVTGDVEDYLHGLEVDDAPAPVVRFGDAGNLAFDANGDVWVFGADEGGRLFRLAEDRTALPFQVDGREYGALPWLPIGACNGVFVDDLHRLWIPCYDGKVLRLDPRVGSDHSYDSVLVRPGLQGTIAVGADETVYATLFVSQQLARSVDGGSLEVMADFDERPWGVAIDVDGTVLVTLDSRIVRVDERGDVSTVSDIAAHRVYVMPDGTVYAARKTGDVYDHREVVRIAPDGSVSSVFSEHDGQGLGPLELHLDLMHDGRLAVFDETQGDIYAIDGDGDVEKLLDLTPIKAFEAAAFAASHTRPEFYVNLEVGTQKYLYRVDLDGNVQLLAEGLGHDPLSADVSADGEWLYVKELGAIVVLEIPDGPVTPTEPNVLPTEAPPDAPLPDATGPADDVAEEDRRALCDAYLAFFAAPPPERGGPLAEIAAHVGDGVPAEIDDTLEVLAEADYGSTDVRPQLKVLGDYVLPLCVEDYESDVVPAADDSAAAEQFLTAVIEGDRALAREVSSELALVHFEPWEHRGIVRGFPRILENEGGFWIELTEDTSMQCDVSDGVVRVCRR